MRKRKALVSLMALAAVMVAASPVWSKARFMAMEELVKTAEIIAVVQIGEVQKNALSITRWSKSENKSVRSANPNL